MKKIINWSTFSILMCMSTASYALTGPADVNLVYIHSGTGQVYLNFSVEVSAGCTHNGTVVLKNDNPRFKELYSALLAAEISGHKVRYSTSGCFGGLYPQLFQLRIYRTDQL